MFNYQYFVLGAALAALTACASTPEPIPEPVLSFQGQDCTANIDLANAIALPDESTKASARELKQMMKNRTIVLSDNFDETSSCTRLASGDTSPYAVFEIPANITGPVIYAGSKVDTNSMFASNVSILDSDGKIVRRFDANDFRRIGTWHAVQFSPKVNETHVLIKADAALLGQTTETSETRVSQQQVVIPYPGGTGVGTNFVGVQEVFSRSFSYDGEVGIRVVFPKQDEAK